MTEEIPDDLRGIEMLHVNKMIGRTEDVLVAGIKREEVLRVLAEIQKVADSGKWFAEVPTTLNEEQCWYVVRHWLPMFSVSMGMPSLSSGRKYKSLMVVSWLRK